MKRLKKYTLSFLFLGSIASYSFYHARSASGTIAGGAVANVQTAVVADVGSGALGTTSVTSSAPAPNAPLAVAKSIAKSVATTQSGTYKDGTYTGVAADAYYGYVQVRVTVQNGKLADVAVLKYPNDRRRSIEINQYALPRLTSEAISAQSAKVATVSGASDTSGAFRSSLASALVQASHV